MQNVSEQIIPVIQNTLELLLGNSAHSKQFLLFSVTAFILLLLLGKLINSTVGASTRGFFSTFFGLSIPLIIAITSYSFAKLYGSTYIADPGTLSNISIAISALSTLFTLLVITPFFLGIGPFKSIIVALLTYFITSLLSYYIDKAITNYYSDKKEIHINQPIFE